MGTPDPSSPWAERVTNPLVSIPVSNPPPSRPPPILSSSRLELQLNEHPAPLADIVKEYSLPRPPKEGFNEIKTNTKIVMHCTFENLEFIVPSQVKKSKVDLTLGPSIGPRNQE
ncbi:hypothetical protein PoB_004553300 [Plakobranchus ocellatus]|uniref:Uncharacterized protein n=1 Tax=Plakobranchus ocellatus TaxID=259542 RepID=A0AAV4BHF2_9GAST|nr:hypothetical protein PoB_004553300 [Plakobranchus ocellatus]